MKSRKNIVETEGKREIKRRDSLLFYHRREEKIISITNSIKDIQTKLCNRENGDQKIW